MSNQLPTSSLELRSLVNSDGTLELRFVETPLRTPNDNEVVIRVEAAPINPSDLGLLLAGTDISDARVEGSGNDAVVTAPIDPGVMRALGARVGQSLSVGNEGAGTVVAAGTSAQAQSLVGRTVALAGGSMYAQYRVVDATACLVLPEGTPAEVGASSFVNPLTALGMLGTMRKEGHGALVHTAAASNLGQMLVKLCAQEDVALVNIVRRTEQADLLRSLGATYVCDSSSDTFMDDLVRAISATSATIGFDATGGGRLASQILTAMEISSASDATTYSRYGSSVHKQVYIYGGLDRGPTILTRSFGFAWGLGGWLLTPYLQSLSPEEFQAHRERVVAGLRTTFASTYNKEISLSDALAPSALLAYSRQATGAKYLITPHKH